MVQMRIETDDQRLTTALKTLLEYSGTGYKLSLRE